MTPIRTETIENKLARLKSNIDFIEDLVEKSGRENEEIIKDKRDYYAIEHMLLISVEIILDIGGHLLVEKFKVSPDDYSDIITKLGNNGVIGGDFAKKQEGIARFRNLLIHEYDKVDENRVISYAREAPAIFRKFGEAFLKAIK